MPFSMARQKCVGLGSGDHLADSLVSQEPKEPKDMDQGDFDDE